MRISRAISSWAGVFALAAMPLLAQEAMRPVLPRITQAIDGTELFPLRGNTHPLAQAANDQGAAPPDLPMERMLLLLRRSPEQEAALKQLLEEQQDPASVNYHHWLAPEQFGEQFGPALEDTDRITGWLKSQGFRVDGVANGRNVVEFSGTAAQVERALHTQIHSYFVNGEQHWANAQDPQIPTALSPVVAGIVSLHNFPAKAMHHRAGAFRKTPGDGAWEPAGLAPEYTLMVSGMIEGLVGPYDFATIYNLLPLWNAGLDGTGQRIAVAGRSNIALQDVRNFRSVFGLPAQDPTITLNGADPGTANVDDEFENVSDVEWAGAIAKGAAINLVVSKSTTATDGSALSAQYIVTNNLAPVLNFSYGKCEMLMTTATSQFYNSLWQQAAAQGITVVVASGDGGSAGCDQNGSAALFGLQVNGIASTPYNVAVGGTDFSDLSSQTSSSYWNSTNTPGTLESAKSYVPEMTWNDSCASPQVVSFFGPDAGVFTAEALCNNSSYMKQVPLLTVAGGGGGASSLYSKPSWQSGVGGIPSDGHRDLPDVSLFAGDGMWLHYYVVCQADNQGPCNPSSPGGLVATGGGGTSFGAPAFSGIMALVNQKIGSRQGLANPALYQLAAAEYGSSSSPNSANLQACNASSPQASSNSCVFYDVTAGNIDVPCVKGLLNCYVGNPSDSYGLLSTSSTSLVPAYAAGTGYDLATGLGSFNAANLVNNWPPPQPPNPPLLSIGKSHTGNFAQGQTSARYTVTVSNGASAGPTSGAVTVTENPPTGLTVVSMAGSGWSCTGSTCTRSDVLSPGSSYPAITVTVNVASNAPSQVTNQVTVSGGGSGSSTASDVTVIGVVVPPVLSVSKSHTGNFAQGQTSATYTVRVSNGASAGPTSGAVTVTENPPTGLTLVSMAGSGWSCTGSTCTRSDVLSSSSSYPAITVTVNVASNAPSQVTNQVTVSGGGSGSATASDPTNLSTQVLIPTTTAVTASPSIIGPTASTTLTAAVTAASGTPTGTVAFGLGSTVLGSPTLTATGGTAQATLVVNGSRLAVGSNSITASYSGDAAHSASAASVTVTVTPPPPPPSGYTIGTVAGNGTEGFSGDGGPAISAELDQPTGVAMDSAGNLFISDYNNNRIRKVTPAGTISTVVGNGTQGFGGDGGPATSAQLNGPEDVALDSAGNLFIADLGNNRIRKVTPAGTISTVAGNGTSGFSGDGGLATSAAFNSPSAVALDGAGNLFISDWLNNRIRKVTPAGAVSTVAGNGTEGFSGDGGLATSAELDWPTGIAVDSAGDLFIAEFNNNRIRKVTPAGTISTVAGNGSAIFGGDGGPATSAGMWMPMAVAVDSAGNLFIADDNRIRKVTPAGSISTVAGNGSTNFSGDGGPATSAGINAVNLALDAAGDLFIADWGNNRIRKATFTPPSLTISKTHSGTFSQGQTGATYTVTVGNPASSAPTSGTVTVTENPPTGLALALMAGSGWNCVGSACTRSDILSPGSSYPAITVTVNVASNAPSQVTNQVTVSGGGSGSATASDVTNIATQVLIPTTTAVTASPSAIATTASTTLTATVTAASGTPTGTVAFNLGSTVLNSATLTAAGSTAQATLVVNGSRLAVGSNSITASYSGDATHSASAASVTVTVTQSTPTASGYTIGTVAGNGIAGPTGDNGLATSAELNGPEGVAMDSSGNLFIADYYNNKVRKVTPTGTITTVAGTGADGFGGDGGLATSALFSHPSGVAVDNAGNLFIADYMNNRIRKVTPGGTISTVAGNGTEGYNGDGIPATSAELWLPIGVAVDGAGNLFIAELTGYRIRKVTPGGMISTVAGNGSPGYNDGPATSAGLNFPSGVAVDGTGNIFIADRGNNFIRKVTPAGMMSRVAGNGNQGFSGDGGSATSAALNGPESVTVDSAGNLFIADTLNERIRKVTPAGTISTVAGNGTRGFSGDGGPATSAGISSPDGVYVDNAGNLFISDFGNNRIRKLASNLNITSVTNGASFQNGFASATWVSIFGADLSQTTRLWQDSDFVNGMLPTALSGVSVTINGLPAYVEYISPTQINVLAPNDATVGAVQVQVTTAQGSSNSFAAQKQQFAPAFFTMGGTYAAAQHADYSYVGKPGLLAGATSQPAKPGETILIYGTGFGPTSPPVSSSQLVTAAAVLANSVQFTIGGVTAPVDYAGLVGAGLYQFNVRVPNVASGDAAVVAQIGGVQTQTGVLITIAGSPAPTPQITSLNPASGQVGTAVALTINGSNLSGVTAVQFSPSTDVTVSNVNATATQVTATVTIDASAAAGSRNVSVSSPAGTSNAVAFTVQTGPGPYDGQWSGSTSQGKSFSMTIAKNVLTVYSYGLNYPNLGSNCPTGSTTTVYTSSSITGSSFSADSISGTFQSETQASGTLTWALIIQQPGCYATGSVTWQATKN